MKFKCIKLEKPTSSQFTVGKVYETVRKRFIVNDKGVECWMHHTVKGNITERLIGYGDVLSDDGKTVLKDWPLMAHFELVSD